MKELDDWLERLIATLHSCDRPLADEMRRHTSGVRDLRGPSEAQRNIVLRVGRPVLAIVDGAAQLDFKDSESEVWRSRLQTSSAQLQRAAGAVGRINLKGRPGVPYVGTGWLVDKDTIATNRHVALEFGHHGRDGFTFTQAGDPSDVSIDFLEEAGRRERLAFPIVEILHIEGDDGPDLALLRVGESRGKALAAPIPLSTAAPSAKQQVAVIGYPAKDSRAPDAQLVQSIFGNVFDKKRLAPGQLTDAKADVLLHDCSTLGGNSGSVVLDLQTGQAVGLHFAGQFLKTNYAVPAALVAERVDQVLHAKPGKPASPRPDGGVRPPSIPTPATDTATPAASEVFDEGVPDDYIGRGGYDPRFIGVDVPLPTIRNTSDVLTFPWQGQQASELKYQHFSVVMNRIRRLCIFSAGNIDGAKPRKFKRPNWRLDARIPKAQQILEECYGNEPMFARGHMTRREDPVWGEPEEASLGNSDSMHVTNTVPQMQPFNAGIWLALESYALDHARSDHMRISVMTGPFLLPDDPIKYGVKIPRSFWKVIAFIHDETRELSATGYTMSQEDFLHDEEFVFGKHKTSQARIATIEERAGLSFGPLTERDPFDGDEEGVGTVLTDPGQIKYRRR